VDIRSPVNSPGTPLSISTSLPSSKPGDNESPELCRDYTGDSESFSETAGLAYVKDDVQVCPEVNAQEYPQDKMDTSLVNEPSVTPDPPQGAYTATVETPDYSSVISIDDLTDDFFCFQQTPVRLPSLDEEGIKSVSTF
jgi:hypothetical protein